MTERIDREKAGGVLEVLSALFGFPHRAACFGYSAGMRWRHENADPGRIDYLYQLGREVKSPLWSDRDHLDNEVTGRGWLTGPTARRMRHNARSMRPPLVPKRLPLFAVQRSLPSGVPHA